MHVASTTPFGGGRGYFSEARAKLCRHQAEILGRQESFAVDSAPHTSYVKGEGVVLMTVGSPVDQRPQNSGSARASGCWGDPRRLLAVRPMKTGYCGLLSRRDAPDLIRL